MFDEEVLERMLEAGEVDGRDTVLEVGPGPGSLTLLLCERAQHVIAVEADEELASGLSSRVPADNLDIITGDILQFDLRRLPADYKVVANLPYTVTSNFLRQLWSGGNQPRMAALLLQKEVAERVSAAPGDMSVLAFSVQYYAKVGMLDIVSRTLFEPPPQVDSAIVRMERRAQPYFEADEPQLFRLVKAGFSQRRKKLANSLAGSLRLDKEEAASLLDEAGIDSGTRGQELSLEQWGRLYTICYNQEVISSK